MGCLVNEEISKKLDAWGDQWVECLVCEGSWCVGE